MNATIQNILIEAGATFNQNITLTDSSNNPVNVSGMTANAAMAIDYYANTVVAIFETNLTNGNLNLRLEANTTVNIRPGSYVYDATIYNGSDVFRTVQGEAEVAGGVTGVIP